MLGATFFACSESESPVDGNRLGGGASEETRFVALENISFSVQSAYVSMDNSQSVKSADYMCLHNAGWIITELDSGTFEKTTRVHKGDVDENCKFNTEDLNLESPYVLVEMYSGENPYRDTISGVFDVSESRKIVIDNITDLVCSRAINLAKNGVEFKNAKAQALQEAMSEFNILNYPKNYEQLDPTDRTNERFMIDYVAYRIMTESDAFLHPDKIKRVHDNFAEYGRINDIVKDSSKNVTWDKTFAENVLQYRYSLYSDVYNYYFPWNLSRDWNLAENIDAYFMNYLAIPFGLGACNENAQGKYYKVDSIVSAYHINPDGLFQFVERDERFEDDDERSVMPYEYLVCDSGMWTIKGMTDVEYTLGSMKDERDGHTYKTTTFVLNGKRQTWMTENLNFDESALNLVESTSGKKSLQKSWCYQDDCDTYGRVYDWNVATRRDSVMSRESMVCEFDEDEPWDDEMDSLDYCSYEKKERIVQGICPDGWRLPSLDEWNALKEKFELAGLENSSWLEMLVKQGLYNESWRLRERFGADLIGFDVLPLGENGVRYPAITENFDNGDVFEFQKCASKKGDEFVEGAKWITPKSGTISCKGVSVRCIKND